ncbi:DUF1223 domain-containing protein [Pseudaminobacter arsenicus]|uniref:DUF1223 domain-containing protein n=1 Tax=Borborobacter arsenicus TaxID=1851146 RepID=A0A432V206_9HYPH|nr:thioredoxin family protein [Pseudaminobacter arsenicus]RUM96234.1 DUF1223 domain-containing protein [Pseudaminobacter arsenicus]
MKYRFFLSQAVALMLLPVFAGTALADDTSRPDGVIELFTSQGCSSCPPADALFQEFAKNPDFVALAYHVDYWDYLGWRDKMSKPESTERQYGYMRSFGSRSVYTPQVVINGRIHVNGAKRADIMDGLAELDEAGQGMSVSVSVERSGDSLMIQAGPSQDGSGKAHLVLVYFDPPTPVGIGTGENKGRTVTYWNAVSDIQTGGMWHGEAATYELPASKIARNGGCAVLLQSVSKEGEPGPVLGAAVLRYSD